ncbi:MAG: tRNA (cytidine(34)-2'-O)-methyltransferase [Phycisphaerales bacterium]|nr:tRNA (cytidine(34)-2'-O)-methyltransferase [Phycisphaerales bacterium]
MAFPAPLLNFVLLEPEIPNNTGNIGRTAAALGCRLHVIHPIGFDMQEKARRRAGLDYWHLVDCVEHASWEAFLAAENPARFWLYSAHHGKAHWNASFQMGDYLLFGKESAGVREDVFAWFRKTHGDDQLLTLPMPGSDGLRSLNLATVVAIAGYEALRQFRLNPA